MKKNYAKNNFGISEASEIFSNELISTTEVFSGKELSNECRGILISTCINIHIYN